MKIKPWSVSDAELAFSQTGPKELPSLNECYKMENEIPQKWKSLVRDWFFVGLDELKLIPRDGIVTEDAMRCIRAELGSWERKHQHKELLIAWLFHQWFSDGQWKVAERKS